MSTHRLAAAACAAAMIAVGLAGCGGRSATGALPPGPDPATTAGAPSAGSAPATTPTATPPTQAGVRSTLAIYYIGNERVWRESDGRPIDRVKLYREFHALAAGDGGPRARTAAAVGEMLEASARDPDYDTGWPSSAHVRDVRIADDVATVDIGGASRNNVGSEVAHQAVQQLVWTATAASGEPGVRLLIDGQPVDELWGHVAVGGVLRRPPAERVLAHVWLIDPQHGASVGRTFTVHVSGYVSESTIYVTARQGDRVVRTTFVTVSGPGLFGEGRVRFTLPAGRYTIEAYAPSNASRGGALFLDGHSVTVG